MHRHAPAHEPPKERYQTQRGLACDTAAKARARSTQCAHCGRGRAYQAAAACPVLHSSPRACMVRLQPEQAWCQQAKLKLSFGLEGEELGCALGTPVRYTSLFYIVHRSTAGACVRCGHSEMCGALACSVAYCGPRTARSAPQERAAVQMAVPLQTRRSALLLAATAPLALRQGVHALAYPQATHLVTTVYQPTVAACGQGERAIAGAAERLLLGQARRARWAWSLRRCRRCRRRACPRQTRARGATLWLTRRQCSGTAIS